MKTITHAARRLFGVAAALHLSTALQLEAANYASSILEYQPGAAASLTNTAAALGEPSRVTPGQFGGPVDPFNPPYLDTQLLSVGAGGFLTIQFAAPVFNNPANPFGLDFLVFGNAGFVITNGDFTGGGITDGSLFGAHSGSARVWVSQDNERFFQLDAARTPPLDRLFPTDGSGDFSIAVNPALSANDFSGKDLAGIRALYGGSGGGTAFDIGWARDAGGQPVALDSIRSVRLESVSGRFEVDGFSAVPEPGSAALLAGGVLVLFLSCLGRKNQPGSTSTL